MIKKIKVFIPCKEANHVCDKTQYRESSFWEKIKLNFHLLYCKACRKYSSNNANLTQTIDKSNVKCMDKKCKESMKQEFEKALKEIEH
ncbi:hypothetical protein [Snuella lapsa]